MPDRDQLLALFLSLDDGIHMEQPPDFDRSRSLEGVVSVRPKLEEALGVELTLDDGWQDSPFFADVHCRELEGNVSRAVVEYTFSAFGDMVYCFRDPLFLDRLSRAGLAKADDVLEANGYVVVPSEVASEPYSGPVAYGPDATWWLRFFATW